MCVWCQALTKVCPENHPSHESPQNQRQFTVIQTLQGQRLITYVKYRAGVIAESARCLLCKHEHSNIISLNSLKCGGGWGAGDKQTDLYELSSDCHTKEIYLKIEF